MVSKSALFLLKGEDAKINKLGKERLEIKDQIGQEFGLQDEMKAISKESSGESN